MSPRIGQRAVRSRPWRQAVGTSRRWCAAPLPSLATQRERDRRRCRRRAPCRTGARAPAPRPRGPPPERASRRRSRTRRCGSRAGSPARSARPDSPCRRSTPRASRRRRRRRSRPATLRTRRSPAAACPSNASRSRAVGGPTRARMRSATEEVPISCNSPPIWQRAISASPRPSCSPMATASSETRSASICGRSARAPDESASARASRIGSGSSATRSSTVRSPKSCTRSRPRRLAAASARLAQSTSPSTERSASPARAAPTETVTGSSVSSSIATGSCPTSLRICSASLSSVASSGTPGASTMNFSPPHLPEHVVPAQPALQAARDDAQHAVADRVAVDRVDAPEVVEIEHEHARRDARAVGARELGGDRIDHVTAAVEARERVGVRPALGLGAPALGLAQRLLLAAPALPERDQADRCEREREGEQDEHDGGDAGAREQGRLRADGEHDPAERRWDARQRAIGHAVAGDRGDSVVEPGPHQLAVDALEAFVAGHDAAGGVEDLPPARAVDERHLDAALAAERLARGGAHAGERELEAHDADRLAAGVAHERRVGHDPQARVGRAVGRRDVHAAGPRAQRRAEEGVAADVARERRGGRRLAAYDARALAAVEADRGCAADEAGLGALECSERLVHVGLRDRAVAGDPAAEGGVAGQQAQCQARAGEEPAEGVGLAVGLQREALIEPGARLHALGDCERDADQREQEARDERGEGGVAHAIRAPRAAGLAIGSA